jgi:hypothetical protein
LGRPEGEELGPNRLEFDLRRCHPPDGITDGP